VTKAKFGQIYPKFFELVEVIAELLLTLLVELLCQNLIEPPIRLYELLHMAIYIV